MRIGHYRNHNKHSVVNYDYTKEEFGFKDGVVEMGGAYCAKQVAWYCI